MHLDPGTDRSCSEYWWLYDWLYVHMQIEVKQVFFIDIWFVPISLLAIFHVPVAKGSAWVISHKFWLAWVYSNIQYSCSPNTVLVQWLSLQYYLIILLKSSVVTRPSCRGMQHQIDVFLVLSAIQGLSTIWIIRSAKKHYYTITRSLTARSTRHCGMRHKAIDE